MASGLHRGRLAAATGPGQGPGAGKNLSWPLPQRRLNAPPPALPPGGSASPSVPGCPLLLLSTQPILTQLSEARRWHLHDQETLILPGRPPGPRLAGPSPEGRQQGAAAPSRTPGYVQRCALPHYSRGSSPRLWLAGGTQPLVDHRSCLYHSEASLTNSPHNYIRG